MNEKEMQRTKELLAELEDAVAEYTINEGVSALSYLYTRLCFFADVDVDYMLRHIADTYERLEDANTLEIDLDEEPPKVLN